MTTQTAAYGDARSVLIGTVLLLTGGVLVGFAAIGLRLSVGDGVGPQATGFWRFFLSLPVILMVFVARGRLPAKPNLFAILTGVFFGLDIGVWHLSLTMTSVANATFIVNMGSLFVGVLAWVFLKDRPSIFWAIAVALALSGVWFLSAGKSAAGGASDIRGDMLALFAACFLSGYFLCGKLARDTLSALDVLFWATATMACVAFILCLVFREPVVPETLGQLKWPLAIAVCSQVLGQGCIIAGLGRVPPAIAGIMVIVQPVASALISWPVFGEALSVMQFIGGGLILVALLVAQRRPARR
ncbi:DMT family transporter [Ponticaulis sp.]|uniref:DMT family transporter n=1 Tax=Ponticaulis sp. TaxID=2020902 RepID=UPI000C489A9E|nr:DMT family transporter [Ponticaulis sp.]MBN04902.1 EamA family transporter [Ponticaulis sp.]